MSSFRQLMMRNKGGGGDIPAQYEVIDYIQSPSTYGNSITRVLDTGIKPSPTEIIYLKTTFNISNSITTNTGEIGCPFGVEGYGQGGVALNTYSGNTHAQGEGNFYNNGFNAGLYSNTKMTVEIKNGIYTTTTGITYTLPAYTTTNLKGNLYVFCNRGTNLSYQAKMKLYEFKMGKSETELVRDYVPVYDTVTQLYGVYDRISQTFDAGTGGSGYFFSGGND